MPQSFLLFTVRTYLYKWLYRKSVRKLLIGNDPEVAPFHLLTAWVSAGSAR